MNRITIIGNLTKEPESRDTQNGTVCKFSVAVARRFNRDATDFFNVVTWKALADNCMKFLGKGKKVAVSGEMQFRTYEDKQGKKQNISEIIADEVEFLSQGQQNEQVSKLEAVDEEIPF